MRARTFIDEDIALYLLLAMVGAIPVGFALWRGRAFGAEATVGLIMMVIALLGVLAVRRRP